MKSKDIKYIILLKLTVVSFIVWAIIIGSTAFSSNLKNRVTREKIVTQDEFDFLFEEDQRDDDDQRQGLVVSRIELGDSALESGNLDSAYAYFSELKELLRDGENLLWATYYNRVGRVKLKEGNTDYAIESLSNAEEYFNKYFYTEEGENDNSSKLDRADNLVELSIAHRIHGNLNVAIEKTKSALLIYTAYGDGEGRAKVFSSQGNIYYAMNELERAEELYKKSLAIYEEELNYLSVGRLYNNIAVIHVVRGDYEVAVEFYNISIDYKKTSGDFKGVALTYRNIAVLYEAKDDLNNAYAVMQRCVEVAQEHNDPKLGDYMEYLKFIEIRLDGDI